MIKTLKLSASAAALALLISGGISSSQAADPVVDDPGCMLSGSVTAGYMFNWQKSTFEIDVEGEGADDKDGDVDWDTPFGEGAGLVTCGNFNVQADVAYYAHSAELDDISSKDIDLDQTNSHIGGALFYRDPSSWAGGVGASWISQDIFGKDIDVFRVGLFGEFYLDDMFTFGASAHYYNTDWPEGKDEDGFELAAWGRFYVNPDFSLMLRGDALLASLEADGDDDDDDDDFDEDLNGFAITGEAEYLVWDQGLSIFGGARYAQRSLEFGNLNPTPPPDVDLDVDVEDFQVFGGIKFYFGHDGTLIERQRTGTVDNTSVFQEKLPAFLPSVALGEVDAEGGAP